MLHTFWFGHLLDFCGLQQKWTVRLFYGTEIQVHVPKWKETHAWIKDFGWKIVSQLIPSKSCDGKKEKEKNNET